MTVTEKTKIGTVDITPTWVAVVPVLLAAIENGTSEGRRLAIEELKRMASIADAYVAANKEADEVRVS